MNPIARQIGDLIASVRARWRCLAVLQATVVASLAASGVLLTALALAYWTGRSATMLAATAIGAVGLTSGLAIKAFWPARRVPSDAQVARFIEEREPSLDDRLVSAVDVASTASDQMPLPSLAAAMLADAGRRAADVRPSTIIGNDVLRRSAFKAGAAVFALCAVVYVGRGTVRRALDAVHLTVFPATLHLDVTPGDARVQAGATLTIQARLAGNGAPVTAQFQRADGEAWRGAEMVVDESGAFRIDLEPLAESFTYRVVAGNVTSPIFEVAVVRPPRVTGVDVEYHYPAALGLPVRTEEDAGDIYAPAGTSVRLRIHTDREAASGHMALGDGTTMPLTAGDGVLEAAFTVQRDDSYRLRVADRDGMSHPGETEYFIRMLDDRPPEVRVLRPARDRSVTALEEVDIEAEAQDDFGIDGFDLVYSVRGRTEKIVPLEIPRRATSVSAAHTLYLEDLDVKPGDFISYHVKARDTPRGRRASETRSDLFFLEVKPFEQEFSLAQSQAQGGGPSSPQLDDLVTAQKEIIVATWKLDRRSDAANGAKSAQDIRAVGRAETELKLRVEQTASTFRDSAMRDPRRRRPATAPRAGQTMPEEDAMTAAGYAMERAVAALNGLRTKDALPPEMEALNRLLEAQAMVKERQVSQQVGSGAGQNRQTQDMSTMFDKELAKLQQTNYEAPKGSEDQAALTPESQLDKIRELAQRQDELNRRQEELARERPQMAAEDLKRQLETLSKEQNELRHEAENLARQMSGQNQQAGSQSGQQGSRGSQPSPSGQQNQQGRSGEGGQPSSGGGEGGQRMREVSEEMRSAASELQREDPTGASARGGRALDKLRELERQMRAATPNEQRRALGDMQMEARQLADAQREVASELARSRSGEASTDAFRRLAGEQERLVGRVQRLQQNLERQAAGTPRGGTPRDGATGDIARAASAASKDIQQQRLGERMQTSAERLRAAAGQPGPREGDGASKAGVPDAARKPPTGVTAEQDAIARALDRLADRLGFANGPQDDESKKLNDQMAKARDLREQIDALSREVERLGREGVGSTGQPSTEEGKASRQPGAPQGGGEGGEIAKLQAEYNRQLKATKDLLDQLRRDDPSIGRSAGGFTLEGRGMVTSAPGTEAFKQDFARWEELRKQATQALEQAESDLSKRLQTKAAKDRLAAGIDDRPPAAYSQKVDRYFKAIAGRKSK